MPATTDPQTPAMLNYSHPNRFVWISRHRWKLIILALMISVSVLVYRNWDDLKHRVLWVYWARQCADFKMPQTDFLRSSDTPIEINRRLNDPDFEYITALPEPFTPQEYSSPYIVYFPRQLQQLRKYDQRIRYTDNISYGSPISFMGKMIRPDGAPRLVILSGNVLDPRDLFGWSSDIQVAIVPIPGLFDSIPQVISSGTGSGMTFDMPREFARLGISQLDPNDSSHLLIQLSYFDSRNSSSGVITYVDGYLENDDSLRLSLWEKGNPNSRRFSLGVNRISGIPKRMSGRR